MVNIENLKKVGGVCVEVEKLLCELEELVGDDDALGKLVFELSIAWGGLRLLCV